MLQNIYTKKEMRSRLLQVASACKQIFLSWLAT